MRARMWGTRGSLPTPGAGTQRYGGNTSCVEIDHDTENHLVVLDAGTGIRELGRTASPAVERVDILLSHLHMDHILGLGFFAPLFRPGTEVHIWGPSSPTLPLRERLARYMSPPLLPVRLREVPCQLQVHDVPIGAFHLPSLQVTATLVCHPGPTVGYRIETDTQSLVYISDHEPALGVRSFPEAKRWTSGLALAADADLLIHDAQYTDAEYADHVGWGHSSIRHALAFADLADVRHMVAFHHDPAHDDEYLDVLYERDEVRAHRFPVTPAQEGGTVELS